MTLRDYNFTGIYIKEDLDVVQKINLARFLISQLNFDPAAHSALRRRLPFESGAVDAIASPTRCCMPYQSVHSWLFKPLSFTSAPPSISLLDCLFTSRKKFFIEECQLDEIAVVQKEGP